MASRLRDRLGRRAGVARRSSVSRVEQTKLQRLRVAPDAPRAGGCPPGAARGRARRSRRPSAGNGARPRAPGGAAPKRSSSPTSSQNSPRVAAPREVVDRPGVAMGDVVEDVVDDVLADALLAVAAEVDRASRPRVKLAVLAVVALKLVALDPQGQRLDSIPPLAHLLSSLARPPWSRRRLRDGDRRRSLSLGRGGAWSTAPARAPNAAIAVRRSPAALRSSRGMTDSPFRGGEEHRGRDDPRHLCGVVQRAAGHRLARPPAAATALGARRRGRGRTGSARSARSGSPHLAAAPSGRLARPLERPRQHPRERLAASGGAGRRRARPRRRPR